MCVYIYAFNFSEDNAFFNRCQISLRQRIALLDLGDNQQSAAAAHGCYGHWHRLKQSSSNRQRQTMPLSPRKCKGGQVCYYRLAVLYISFGVALLLLLVELKTFFLSIQRLLN
jgi:hypothetical protein